MRAAMTDGPRNLGGSARVDPRGDRRGSNPRHLEPQPRDSPLTSENHGNSGGRAEPEKAPQSHDFRPLGGSFVERATAELQAAFRRSEHEVDAWQRAVKGALEGDEEGTLWELAALARPR